MQKSQKVSLVVKNRIQRFLRHDENWQLVQNQDEHLIFKNNDKVTLHLYQKGTVLIQGSKAEAVYNQLFISSQDKVKLKRLLTKMNQFTASSNRVASDLAANANEVKEGLKNFYINFFDHQHLMTFFAPWTELELSEKMLRVTAQTLKWWINNCNGVRHAGDYDLALLAPGILTCLRILLRDYLI